MPFVLSVVVVAVALSALRGGRFANVAHAPLHRPWLLFVGVALQLGVDVLAAREVLADASTLGWSVLLASQLLVVAFLVVNRQLPGVWFVGVGLLLNAVVMAANGAMPVSPAAVEALQLGRDVEVPLGKHTMLDEDTLLPWLADVIPVRPLRSVLSLGDVVLAVGIVPMAHGLMTWPRTATDEHETSSP